MRRRMLASVGGKPLPYLRRVAYLESSKKQFIDTGLIVPSDDTNSADIVLEMVDLTGASAPTSNFFGASNSWDSGFGIGQENRLQVAYGKAYTGFNKFEVGGVHHVSLSFGIITVDGMTVEVAHTTDGIPNASMILFGMRRGVSVQQVTLPMVRIFSFRYASSIRAIDFIPVLDRSGRPCMYDQSPRAVPDDDPSRFFYNQGDGEFTWGELGE